MKISLRQLEIFKAVAKYENTLRAAEILHLSQSAISMAITNLETQLNSKLFDRHGKRLILNSEGKVLLGKAVSIINQIDELTSGAKDKSTKPAGQITIAASATIGNYILPKLLTKFMQKYPDVRINLNITNSENAIQQLLGFNVDIAIIEGECQHPDIECLPWLKDELIIFAPYQHALGKRQSNKSALKQLPWIVREKGSGTRAMIERWLGSPINIVMELNQIEAIKEAVMAGLGVSCLSLSAVKQDIKDRHLTRLKTKESLHRDFLILIHKEKYRSNLLTHFLEFCLQY